jgi:hypothetical protein
MSSELVNDEDRGHAGADRPPALWWTTEAGPASDRLDLMGGELAHLQLRVLDVLGSASSCLPNAPHAAGVRIDAATDLVHATLERLRNGLAELELVPVGDVLEAIMEIARSWDGEIVIDIRDARGAAGWVHAFDGVAIERIVGGVLAGTGPAHGRGEIAVEVRLRAGSLDLQLGQGSEAGRSWPCLALSVPVIEIGGGPDHGRA